MKVQLTGNGTGRLQNVIVEVSDYTVRVVVQNLVVYSESYGPESNTDFETAWARIGEKLKYYGES